MQVSMMFIMSTVALETVRGLVLRPRPAQGSRSDLSSSWQLTVRVDTSDGADAVHLRVLCTCLRLPLWVFLVPPPCKRTLVPPRTSFFHLKPLPLGSCEVRGRTPLPALTAI